MKTNIKWTLLLTRIFLIGLSIYGINHVIHHLTAPTANIPSTGKAANSARLSTHITNILPSATDEQPYKNQYQSFSDNLPRYLSNTELRGELPLHADGSLLITAGIKRRFDYFYMMTGDRSHDDIYAIIIDHLQQELLDPARSQALTLLKQYTDYLHEYHRFSQGLEIKMMQEDPLWVTEEINNLRHFHLGKDISDIFFYQQQALRDQRQGSQTELPLNLQQQQANTLRLTNLQKQTQQLISTGADTEMIQRMRNEHLGQEAADRLAILDNNRHIWQTKRQNYQALKAQWNDVSGLSVSDKTQAFEQYAREKLALNKQELKRMQALDRIQAHAKL